MRSVSGQNFVFSVYMGNFSSVNEMNKARPFKFHPGNGTGVFIWKIF